MRQSQWIATKPSASSASFITQSITYLNAARKHASTQRTQRTHARTHTRTYFQHLHHPLLVDWPGQHRRNDGLGWAELTRAGPVLAGQGRAWNQRLDGDPRAGSDPAPPVAGRRPSHSHVVSDTWQARHVQPGPCHPQAVRKRKMSCEKTGAGALGCLRRRSRTRGASHRPEEPVTDPSRVNPVKFKMVRLLRLLTILLAHPRDIEKVQLRIFVLHIWKFIANPPVYVCKNCRTLSLYCSSSWLSFSNSARICRRRRMRCR